MVWATIVVAENARRAGQKITCRAASTAARRVCVSDERLVDANRRWFGTDGWWRASLFVLVLALALALLPTSTASMRKPQSNVVPNLCLVLPATAPTRCVRSLTSSHAVSM